MTLYQIDPNLHPDDPMQELVRQWIGTVLLAVPIEADIAPISGNHCPTCGVIEPHLHVYRWVGEETP